MKFATTLTLAALGLSLSSASMADDCVKQTFTNVKDNSWSAVTWDAEKSGLFAVTLKQSSNHFGAWGKNGKLRMQIQVNGQWQYAEGHTESGTAYHGARDVKDTLDTDEGITGIRLQTPTWTSKTGGGTIEVCSNSVEDIVHSAPTFKTGRTFSEEQPAWTSGVQSHQPISSLSCFGRYCDNMKAEFRTDSLVATQGKDWWSHKFSEENNGNAQCPTNHAVTEVQCRGDYCDDLTLKCTPLKDATIYETYKTNWISEENAHQGLNVADCEDGVVIGAACKGRYCDEIQLTCGVAAPNKVTMLQQRWEYEGCTTTIPQDRVDHFIGNNRSWTQVKGAMQDFATNMSEYAADTCQSDEQYTEDGWRKCAKEGETCELSSEKLVRYGADGHYFYFKTSDSFTCTFRDLGHPNNPLIPRRCDVISADVTQPEDNSGGFKIAATATQDYIFRDNDLKSKLTSYGSAQDHSLFGHLFYDTQCQDSPLHPIYNLQRNRCYPTIFESNTCTSRTNSYIRDTQTGSTNASAPGHTCYDNSLAPR